MVLSLPERALSYPEAMIYAVAQNTVLLNSRRGIYCLQTILGFSIGCGGCRDVELPARLSFSGVLAGYRRRE